MTNRLVTKLMELDWDEQQFFYLLPLWLRDEVVTALSDRAIQHRLTVKFHETDAGVSPHAPAND